MTKKRLAGILCVLVATPQLHAQDESRIAPFVQAQARFTNAPTQELAAGWQERFLPNAPGMSIETAAFSAVDLGLGIEARCHVGPIRVRPNLYARLVSLGHPNLNNYGMDPSEGHYFLTVPMSWTTTTWWDTVPVQRTSLKTSPDAGIAVDLIRRVAVRYSLHRAELFLDEYRGVDVPAENYSRVVASRKLATGIGHRWALEFLLKDGAAAFVFVEADPGHVTLFGMGVGYAPK